MATRNPSLRRPRSGKFSSDLCLFWHGIFEGRKYPISFYTASSRSALRREVERAIDAHVKRRDFASADRLARLWELISLYIEVHNEAAAAGEPDPQLDVPASSMPAFLHLLYAGEKPACFWRKFSRRSHLHAVPPSNFWDYFEEFQPHRMEMRGWLAANARGKVLDLGSGAHSYVPVDTAADISRKALEKNKNAKRKVRIRPLGEMTAKNWPFAKSSFDTIMLNSVLSYAKNRARLFGLCRAALRPNGVLLITNAPVMPHHPASLFIASEPKASELARELKKAGFAARDESEGRLIRLIAAPA